MRPVAVGASVGLAVVLALTGLSACRTSLFDRTDQSVDHAKAQVDDSVEKAKQKIDDAVEKATTKVTAAVGEARSASEQLLEKARTSYDSSLKETGAEVDRLREEFRRDLTDLDKTVQARLDQIRTSALDLVTKTDESVQKRLDQLFTELNRFMTDTLDRITKLIQPILDMATKIGTAVENGDKHISEVLAKVTPILDSVKAGVDSAKGALDEAKSAIMKIQGKNSDGTPAENPWWTRGLVGFAATALAWWRANDKKKNGDRWKREELTATTKQDVGDLLKSGEYDDEIAGRIAAGALDSAIGARLVTLGALKIQTVPTPGGGDPAQGTGRAPSPPA